MCFSRRLVTQLFLAFFLRTTDFNELCGPFYRQQLKAEACGDPLPDPPAAGEGAQPAFQAQDPAESKRGGSYSGGPTFITNTSLDPDLFSGGNRAGAASVTRADDSGEANTLLKQVGENVELCFW